MSTRTKTADVTAAKPASAANGTVCKDDLKKPEKQTSVDYQAGFTSGYSL